MKVFAVGFHFLFCLLAVAGVDASRLLRQSAGHSRTPHASAAMDWKTLQDADGDTAAQLVVTMLQEEGELLEQQQILEQEEAAIAELVDAMVESATTGMSMGEPTQAPTTVPTVSVAPTAPPSTNSSSVAPTVSVAPSVAPTDRPTMSLAPTNSSSVSPTVSVAPSVAPTDGPTVSLAPTNSSSVAPTVSVAPSVAPTDGPTISLSPTNSSSMSPTVSVAPSVAPTDGPTVSARPTIVVTGVPSNGPTLSNCQLTPQEREAAILGLLDQVANSTLIRNRATPQGLATDWIINEDVSGRCPDHPKLIQRWALAVMYFSTGGDDWTECFADDVACTTSLAFLGDDAFLSESNECEWAGISCDLEGCVTEIEYEENNLVGTIPTELGLLEDLVRIVIIMVRKGLCELVLPMSCPALFDCSHVPLSLVCVGDGTWNSDWYHSF
jgi:hypothetical protein